MKMKVKKNKINENLYKQKKLFLDTNVRNSSIENFRDNFYAFSV